MNNFIEFFFPSNFTITKFSHIIRANTYSYSHQALTFKTIKCMNNYENETHIFYKFNTTTTIFSTFEYINDFYNKYFRSIIKSHTIFYTIPNQTKPYFFFIKFYIFCFELGRSRSTKTNHLNASN